MRTKAFVLAIALASLAACSGGGGSHTNHQNQCSTFSACGGDLVGTWVLDKQCVGEVTACPEATFTVTQSPSITFTFTSDGSVEGSFSGTQVTHEVAPRTCLGSSITSCEQADSSAVTCTNSGTDQCACDITIAASTSLNGTYSASGSSVTIVESGQSTQTFAYCATGDTLVLQLASVTSGYLMLKRAL